MSETRDDLREALARCIEPAAFSEGTPNRPQRENGCLSPGQRSALRKANAQTAGPLAPILAQVSALQAEVEEARQDAREAGHNGGHLLHQLDQAKVEIRRLSAEVERLQKVEGERAAARDDLEAVDALATEWCQGRAYRSSGSEDARDGYVRGATSVAGEVRRLIHARDPEFHNRIAARQAPSDNPLTETKEGSDAKAI